MAWFVWPAYEDRAKGTELAPEIEPIPQEEERFRTLGLEARAAIKERWNALGRPQDSPDLPFYGTDGPPPLGNGWRWPMFDAPLRARLRHAGSWFTVVAATSTVHRRPARRRASLR